MSGSSCMARHRAMPQLWLCCSLMHSAATLCVCPCAGVVDVANGSGSVELKRYPKSHPFAQLSGSDNIIAFTTQRYAAQPLIVR